MKSHFSTEAGILIREFEQRGFDCRRLVKYSVFNAALGMYGGCQLTFDELVNVAETLAIFDHKVMK